MSTTQTSSESKARMSGRAKVDLKLEVVAIPVSDVERAKRFYGGLGWRLDADIADGENFRVVQLTPPGSQCSIHFGKGVTAATPGSAQGLFLVVDDIQAARDELVGHGVEVTEAFHYGTGHRLMPGRDPEGRSYFTYASFKDPDGNRWVLQEIKTRLPGRV
jgi:catechol 2,3-dioxygenase-like lactoylglutathione lyase family enzyme